MWLRDHQVSRLHNKTQPPTYTQTHTHLWKSHVRLVDSLCLITVASAVDGDQFLQHYLSNYRILWVVQAAPCSSLLMRVLVCGTRSLQCFTTVCTSLSSETSQLNNTPWCWVIQPPYLLYWLLTICSGRNWNWHPRSEGKLLNKANKKQQQRSCSCLWKTFCFKGFSHFHHINIYDDFVLISPLIHPSIHPSNCCSVFQEITRQSCL